MASLYDYYVIDLEATRRIGRPMFYAPAMRVTPRLENAIKITEEFISGNTESYDNGTTTRAILCSVVDSYPGNLMDLISSKVKEPCHD